MKMRARRRKANYGARLFVLQLPYFAVRRFTPAQYITIKRDPWLLFVQPTKGN